ncbi:MAG: peptidylprolyl isomerase [Hydrogenophaga sp.]|nr:peptidylprolyl isomerase [Hydrogenophaga sp.]
MNAISHFGRTWGLGLAFMVLGAFGAQAQEVVAKAGVASVTTLDLKAELARIPEANRRAMLANPNALTTIANNLLVRRLLAQEAVRDGLDKDPLNQAQLQISRDRALSDMRLATMDLQNNPSPAALDAYALEQYRVNQARYERPAQTRASHILLEDKGTDSLAQAKVLVEKLRAGASFAELAKEHSTDPGSAARGGDLGFFAAGAMVRPFEDGVNALEKPGDISEPVKSQFGWHIIRLDERRPKSIAPFEEVKDKLVADARTALLNQSRQAKVANIQKEIEGNLNAIEAFIEASKKAP